MLDFSHLPTSTNADVQVFNSTTSGHWHAWNKPRGVSTLAIMVVGSGGDGNGGNVGAAGGRAGGGGGGSGGQTFLLIPANRLPDTLYARVAGAPTSPTYIALYPSASLIHTVIVANGGTTGGSPSFGTGGTAGAAGAVATIAAMPLAGMGVYTLLAGQAGTMGGGGADGTALTLPTTGLIVTGGTGGGGSQSSGNTGRSGGSFTVAGAFPPQSGGIALSVAQGGTTVPGPNGSNGFDNVIAGLRYSYGGTGGASAHPDASGAGLFGGNGGNGGIGCGGGGGGSCITGGVAGVGGRGGPGQIIIIAW